MEHKNLLYYGDNLAILRDYIKSESIDLVYLDPPFNSNRNYNVLFKDESGHASEAQITAFEDTWHWNQTTEHVYQELVTGANPQVASMISALRQFIGTNQMMAYLVMMAVRLVELRRVLKPTGSLYLHCDPTASHYLKILMDAIFEPQNFINEIVWKRTTAHGDAKQGSRHFGRIHDIILRYAKSADFTWNPLFIEYEKEFIDSYYKFIDSDGRRYWKDNVTAAKPGGDTLYSWNIKRLIGSKEWQADLDGEYEAPKNGWEYKSVRPTEGRYWAYSKQNMKRLSQEGRLVYSSNGLPMYKRYLDEMPGRAVQDWWDDIRGLGGLGSKKEERLGYPTQKPVALLERILQASSNPGDSILDPFCGCGTTIAAAQKLNRRWIGIDITHLSIALQKFRLKDAFGLVEKRDYEVIGEPVDLEAAKQLSQDDRYQFQWWALSLVKARPLGGDDGSKTGKKGSDRGIDGVIHIIDNEDNKANRILIQVKSGKVKSGDIRDLRGVIDREGAVIGVFITLEEPTKEMITEAASTGFYHSPGWGTDYPKLQILTIADLLNGAEIKMPPASITFKKAEKVKPESKTSQPELI